MGFFPVSTVILSMGIFYGGIAQIIAGIIAYKRGNIFAATAFTSYGFFWITLIAIWMLPSTEITLAGTTSGPFLGCYLLLWGIFTTFMWYANLGRKQSTTVYLSFISDFIFSTRYRKMD